MTPDWLPVEYLTCPTQLAMRKIAAITPAGYFCMIRKPHFLSMDRLGVDQKFYLNPEYLPSNDNPLQVIMEASGRYEEYRFGNRHAVAAIKAKKELEGSKPQTSTKCRNRKPGSQAHPGRIGVIRHILAKISLFLS